MIGRYSEFHLHIAGERDAQKKAQQDISRLPLFLADDRLAAADLYP